MHARCRIAAIALIACALLAGPAALAQDDDTSAPKPPVAEQSSPGDAARPPVPDKATKPDGGGATGPEIGPNRMAIRARYDANMQTVDSGIAELAPFIGRTVIGLKRLALDRRLADSSFADRQRRRIAAGLRGLAVAERRLRRLDLILDRWRMAPPTTPSEQAAMLAGVFRRASDVDILRRRIACGRYFGATADRAARSGIAGAVRVPPGC